MNKEQIIKLAVRQLIEEGKIDAIEKIFSKNYIAHAGEKEYKGHDFIKKFTKQLRLAIPDIKVVKVEFLNRSDNVVTWQRTFSGTHKKNMKGISASGRRLKWTEIVVSRFENRKIFEEWIVSELKGELLLKVPADKK